MEQLLARLRIGNVLHPLRHRAMGDDLRAFEELIPPHMVGVFVGVDDAPRHGGPDLAKHVDHLPRVGQVRLRIDHHAARAIDEARVGVADPVLLVQNRKAVVADLLHFHRVQLSCALVRLTNAATMSMIAEVTCPVPVRSSQKSTSPRRKRRASPSLVTTSPSPPPDRLMYM